MTPLRASGGSLQVISKTPLVGLVPDSIAIVGYGEGHRHLAPFDDPAWEMWGLNRLWRVFPDKPWTRWFELHDLASWDPDHLDWLTRFAGPVYVRPQDVALAQSRGVSTAVAYPLNEVLAVYGRYFNNSISWLIALALLEGAAKIGLWGIDMAADSFLNAEFAHQRPSVEFLLGWAKGSGVEVVLGEGSDLLKTMWLYGFEEAGVFEDKLACRIRELETRKTGVEEELIELDRRRFELLTALARFDGALEDVKYWGRVWSPTNAPQVEAEVAGGRRPVEARVPPAARGGVTRLPGGGIPPVVTPASPPPFRPGLGLSGEST